MRASTFIAYYNGRDDAISAIRGLPRGSYRRAVLAERGASGGLRLIRPFIASEAARSILASAAAGIALSAASFLLGPGFPTIEPFAPEAFRALVFGLAGASAYALLTSAIDAALGRKIASRRAVPLFSGETVLIVEAPRDRLQAPLELLSGAGDIAPALFVFPPHHPVSSAVRDAAYRRGGMPLSTGRLQDHARSLSPRRIALRGRDRGERILKGLEARLNGVQRACAGLSEADRLHRSLPLTAEWLLDNEYVFESNARDVKLNMSRKFSRYLPVLEEGKRAGLPRVYDLAVELALNAGLQVGEENAIDFLEAFQADCPLTIGELWAFPQMLRIALLESIADLADESLAELRDQESANFWANRLITSHRRDPDRFFSAMAALSEACPSPSLYFASQLIDYIYDDAQVLAPVRGWLERVFEHGLNELLMREKHRLTRDQLSIGNAFTSLRQLGMLDWKPCFERLNATDRLLRSDPAGIYPRMDFATRDEYRHAVEELSRGGKLDEPAVARLALELATSAKGGSAENPQAVRPRHVGTYLIGEGRRSLAALSRSRETLRHRVLAGIYRRHSSIYAFCLLAVFFAVLSVFAALASGDAASVIVLAAIAVLPASQLALGLLNAAATRILPPRGLPKMDFSRSGIPDAFKTLVVVPVILQDRQTVVSEAEKLEIRYLANPERNLVFGLFSDFKDSGERRLEEDDGLLGLAKERIDELERRYGGGKFLLFHRERRWCESEGKYIGWERKRGKLEELNDLLTGRRAVGAENLLHAGEPSSLNGVRYVITLDSDSQLPQGTARRMVEAMAHPLNEAILGGSGRVESGYGLIQPRMSVSLPNADATPFSRLYTDPEGVDPYTRMVSDLYQDLCAEGSYHGKGIYDVRCFSAVLSGRFPESTLLSHDLLEGAYVRTGFSSDIELYDDFPSDYLGYAKRQHRWIRGDWQIAPWLLPSVPSRGGKRESNPLSPMNRWKILDNLRRSLVPVSDVALLIAAWSISPRTALAAAGLVFLHHAIHPFLQTLAWAGGRKSKEALPFLRIGRALLRVLAEMTLLPHRAAQSLDAIGRVLYRKAISRKKLLEWTQAQAMEKKAKRRFPRFALDLFLSGMSAVAIGIAALGAFSSAPPSASALLALPWLCLWAISPLAGMALCVHPEPKERRDALSPDGQRFLRRVARLTWRYFDDFVDEESSWLPPDNYQVSHQRGLARRTSPTNIGLYLCSILCARDFGYLSIDEAGRRLRLCATSMLGLERHEGHLLNWYDTSTREGLHPRYVSMVDSGNLLGALWTLDRGIRAIIREPLLDARAFSGMADGAASMRSSLEARIGSKSRAPALDAFAAACGKAPGNAVASLASLGALAETASTLAALDPYWGKRLAEQTSDWLMVADRYLRWIETLAERDPEEIEAIRPGTRGALVAAVERAPSLHELATGGIPLMREMGAIRDKASAAGRADLVEWADRAQESYDRSKWLAGEMLDVLMSVVRDCGDFSGSVNMGFLYNEERRLFSIGYNVTERRLDRVFYDLLASEARLGSFVAVARGDVPAEHWFAMGRPYGAVGGRRILLSWTGTMFEYLMPLLFQKSYRRSLLDKAAREAVSTHIAHGRRFGVPWGISECAYGDLDAQKTYQYQAFGIRDIALKRALPDKEVVAPYATLLSLLVDPRASAKNLRRLARLGLLSDFGFFEALDLSREPGQGRATGILVRAYMAHHQAMGFLSLANILHGDRLRGYFHSDPRVRMAEPLLQERVPRFPPLHHVSTRYRLATVAPVTEAIPSVSQFDTPHGVTPKTQLLCNGRYGLMVTSSGGGYSRWGDFDITRWRADTTRDDWGVSCYLRDLDSGRLWASAYHPVCGRYERYDVTFSLDRALYKRVEADISSEMEIIVAPEDDVEIRRITLVNRSPRQRRIGLTSYIELAMAPHGADRQHPAFSKLFIRTEAFPEKASLLASRRPRGPNDAPIYAFHRLCAEGFPAGLGGGFGFETDRRRFIGRGRDLSDPMGVSQVPGGSQGFVLDPIFSMSVDLTLGIGERTQVTLVLGASESREGALALMDKYGDPRAVDRAMDFAWVSAQIELRLLRIQSEDARRYQQLASHLLYPNQLLRASAKRISENRKGQSGLWAYAVSGDLPIALISVGETQDLGLVRQILQAHAFWRLRGLKADLVILNEESGSYVQPLKEELERLVQYFAPNSGLDCPGGIFLRNSSHIPPEDLTLLRASASLSLVASRGLLPQQLAASYDKSSDLPEPFVRKKAPRDPSSALPFMDLHFFNSLGGFTADGSEYAIYLGPGMHTPAPWVNVIANPGFGAIISETGSGFTWRGNSQRNRLTPWSNDPVTDPPSEAIYIRDEDTGAFWTPTARPVREESAYRVRHGSGYTAFEHNSNGIDQELVVFVPVDGAGGQPVKLQKLRLRNETDRTRRLSITYYVEWALGENRELTQMHVVTSWDEESGAVMARNAFSPDPDRGVAFAAVSPRAASFTGDRGSFIGRNRSMANPAAMERSSLSRRVDAGMDPCAALQAQVRLLPGETAEAVFVLGQAASTEDARALMASFLDIRAFDEALESTKEWWNERLGSVQAHTPELALDILVNRWLLYQTLSCRMWARSGFYQSGGAFGFRDQLQDSMALVYSAPSASREHLLIAAGRQFKEGDVQHWWHPAGGQGIRSRVSDDLLWLPYAAAHYVMVTGDSGVLGESVPFLDAPPLADGQLDCVQTPSASAEAGSLWEHCRRAVARARRLSPRGLPLMGSGDWNDGMNLVGAGGKGESVWLGWFMADVLRGMSEMAGTLGLETEAKGFRLDRASLIGAVEAAAWDGEWYTRATFDDGSALGSRSSREAKIDSLSQSWAVISEGAGEERASTALGSAWTRLVRKEDSLVLLFAPPFEDSKPSPGYIQGYPPGVRENGGQYTHAAVWLAMAYARRGEGDKAGELTRMLNPIEHAREPAQVWRYGVEPYVACADVYALSGLEGQGGWSWYTGSAAWLYRAWVEDILGLRVRGDAMKIEPAIPSWWDGYQLRYRHGEAVYDIRVENPGHVQSGVVRVEIDGKALHDDWIALESLFMKHRVTILMGSRKSTER